MSDAEHVHYAPIIDRGDIQELKLALLRSIDHARKSAAEVAEYKAKLDGALGLIAELRSEIEILRRHLGTAPDRESPRP